ncbi:MAG: transketolase [Patescibacteria group bacterium]|nr:transketolase [Patescibacteria group bacterium]
MEINKLQKIAKLLRYYSLTATTAAGSGHPTSSLSAADLMAALVYGGTFRFDIKRPGYKNNDRLIFSKGHASPLFYSLFKPAGGVTEKQLMTLRKFGSPLEGHPTMEFAFTEAPTGSLGQGLSVGAGMALAAKYLDRLPYRAYVLLGDSELAEGSCWEAMAFAAFYKLDNLVAIVDVNRLGQRGETMYGYEMSVYKKRAEAFGWKVLEVPGHNLARIVKAYEQALAVKSRPVMILAKTVKGKGVKFLENKDGWHGKPLSPDELKKALKELGAVDKKLKAQPVVPGRDFAPSLIKAKNYLAPLKTVYKKGDMVATRKAYGQALARLGVKLRDMVVLDAEVSNSTYAEIFKASFPERFFEMYIAEQNMVGVALGLARRGKIPFLSTFSAFLTRAFDQLRMAGYADARLICSGSHGGVSIGQDGVSQMGLEDIAQFRSIWNSIVLYPADAVSCDKLVEAAAGYKNVSYIRTTRSATRVIYGPNEKFPVGGCKVLRQSRKDTATVVAAGITIFEALKAYESLKQQGIAVRVIDLYSVKPLDGKTLLTAAKETGHLITVEDHYPAGGIGEAVATAIAGKCQLTSLAVRKLPRSGTPEELLAYEGIDAAAIESAVKKFSKIA